MLAERVGRRHRDDGLQWIETFAVQQIKWGKAVRAQLDIAQALHDRTLRVLETCSTSSSYVRRELTYR